ncbi:hypothetical protein QTP88_012404 [Uroleucon formosanum]
MYSVTIILFVCFCIFSESLDELVVLSRVPLDPRKKFNAGSQHLGGIEYTAADSRFRSSSPPPICDCSQVVGSQVSECPYPYVVGSQVTGRRPTNLDVPQENGYRPPHMSCSKKTGHRPSMSTNCPTHECSLRSTMSPWPPCRTSPVCTTCQTTLPPCIKFRTASPCTTCRTLPPCTTCRTLPPCTMCRTLPPCTTCWTLPPCTTCRTLPPCTTCRTLPPCTTCRTLPPCTTYRTTLPPCTLCTKCQTLSPYTACRTLTSCITCRTIRPPKSKFLRGLTTRRRLQKKTMTKYELTNYVACDHKVTSTSMDTLHV